MRAAIVDPYLDTLGGGERYMLSVARTLKEEGWEVDVQGNVNVLSKAAERLKIDLGGVNAVADVHRGDRYELCFWLSDGSVPRLLARKNILHFQRPFYNVDGKSLLNRMKFFGINSVVVNSEFTKKWIDEEFPCEAKVLYPPVDVAKFKSKRKENLIVYVGRFSQLEQAKHQDVLVGAFSKFVRKNSEGAWKLVLAGGSDVGGREYVRFLQKKAKNLAIELVENAPFNQIVDFYGKASMFWSAAGYGVDQAKHPEKMEHFGITVVEAMAAGAVPFVFAGGGHTEIVYNKQNGFVWRKPADLVKEAIRLANDKSDRNRLSKQAISDSKKFSYTKFKTDLLELI